MSKASEILKTMEESWFSNELIPEIDTLKGEGNDVSTRKKAIAVFKKALKDTKSMDRKKAYAQVLNYLEKMAKDKEYEGLYKQFIE